MIRIGVGHKGRYPCERRDEKSLKCLPNDLIHQLQRHCDCQQLITKVTIITNLSNFVIEQNFYINYYERNHLERKLIRNFSSFLHERFSRSWKHELLEKYLHAQILLLEIAEENKSIFFHLI